MEDIERKLIELQRLRRRRNLIGAILISMSIVLMEIAIIILLGIIAVTPIVAVILILIAPISMAIGLYMLLTQQPIILE